MSKQTQQRVLRIAAGGIEELCLPPADEFVMGGIRWGQFDVLFTPAFWAARMWIDDLPPISYRIGQTASEEIVACLLGGYGMPAEMGVKAFERLRDDGLILSGTRANRIEAALARPFPMGGRLVRYRYPRQKAKYVAAALGRFGSEQAPSSAAQFRLWLLSFEGIGLKTASWITRNLFSADDVAILDVHIQRAGLLMGIFSRTDSVERDYLPMEHRLVDFARAMNVRLSVLDDLIWRYMKGLNRTALGCVEARG